MVKVTVENDKNKDEITGEFFMGVMLTKEEKTEDSTTYKACSIGKGIPGIQQGAAAGDAVPGCGTDECGDAGHDGA